MHQKDMTVLIRRVPNNRASRETKHNMLEIQGKYIHNQRLETLMLLFLLLILKKKENQWTYRIPEQHYPPTWPNIHSKGFKVRSVITRN